METLKYNYYDVLEVSPISNHQDVSTAYEKIKMTYSGDNPAIYTIFTPEEARELLKLAEEAYSVLGNKALRALYDEKVALGLNRQEDISYETLKAQSKIFIPSHNKAGKVDKANFVSDDEFEKEIRQRTEWDGLWLKKVRDYRAISVEKMSEVTKVSAFYINAIECMNFENLPASVFIRGYVDQIAKTLGLDAKVVCSSYMKIYKEKFGK